MSDEYNQNEKEIADKYRGIGKILGESLGDGLEDGGDKVKAASDKVYRDLLGRYQFYLKEKERLEKENAALTEATHRQTYEKQLSRAKNQERAEEIHQKEMLRLQKQANQEYLKEVKAQLKTIEALKKDIVSDFGEVSSFVEDRLSDVTQARERMEEKLQGYGGLFQERTVVLRNVDPKRSKFVYKDLIADLSKERKDLETYAGLLREIGSMENIPQELFYAIRELSVEDGIRFQQEFLKLSPKEKEDYLKDWEAIATLSKQVADMSYAQETELALADIDRELSAWFSTIPEGFFAEGEFSAEAFGEGFVKRLRSMQESLQAAVLSVVSIQNGMTEEKGQPAGNQTSVTYILNSAGETVSEQLRSAEKHATIERLRGV